MRIRIAVCGFAIALLSACGGEMKVLTPMAANSVPPPLYTVDDVVNQGTIAPPSFGVVIKEQLESSLKDKEMLAAGGATSPRHIKIVMTKFRMRSDPMRFLFGFFAGTDYVNSTVTVVDGETGAKLGETTVHAFNGLAFGSGTTIAEYHAQQVLAFVRNTERTNVDTSKTMPSTVTSPSPRGSVR